MCPDTASSWGNIGKNDPMHGSFQLPGVLHSCRLDWCARISYVASQTDHFSGMGGEREEGGKGEGLQRHCIAPIPDPFSLDLGTQLE